MVISKDNIIITNFGACKAINGKNILTDEDIIPFYKTECEISTKIIKTKLFPSFSIGFENNIFIGKLSKTNNKIVMTNMLKKTEKIRRSDYIITPKIQLIGRGDINKITCFIYANFIKHGYFTNNNKTAVIYLEKMPKEEINEIKAMSGIILNQKRQTIFIKNKNINHFLQKYMKNIPVFFYSLDERMLTYFYNNLNIKERPYITKYETLAFDLFMLSYLKLNRIYKIEEIKNNQKKYKLSLASYNDYIISDKILYSEIENITIGKKMIGYEFDNKNKRTHLGFYMAV